jgi:NAD(P)-dependent dehydrogenase (short-subunit alcohol dehydrogenase family)
MPASKPASPTSKKVWFITGAASGFGRAFAEYALSHGHRVAAAATSPAGLQDLAARAPDRVALLTLDFTSPGDAESAVAEALSRFGRLDVLINAPSYGATGTLEDVTDSQLRALMEANFYGVMAVTRAVLPIFRAQHCGAIVNILSMGEPLSTAFSRTHAVGIFALDGASEALAQEMAPFGVRVLIVEPGQFHTDLASGGAHSPVGDPAKAAAAVETALEADVTPLHLALGGDAVDAVRHHCQTMLADLAKWEPISRATSY